MLPAEDAVPNAVLWFNRSGFLLCFDSAQKRSVYSLNSFDVFPLIRQAINYRMVRESRREWSGIPTDEIVYGTADIIRDNAHC